MNKALRHEGPERVPVSDFFRGGFLRRWREELGLSPDTDICRYYDLDRQVVSPNMDPHIRQFEILREDETEVTVRTGFGATLRKVFDQPMPAFIAFETDTIEAGGVHVRRSVGRAAVLLARRRSDERRRRRVCPGNRSVRGPREYALRRLPGIRLRLRGSRRMIRRIAESENVLMWMAAYPDAIYHGCGNVNRIFENFIEISVDA